ncbi:S26 family signal peptidase [Thermococcus chitonophagus]|uniref:S26 family signal peptidase n=1 Tax=Thermococcus chitonophagus TaxID=54262 RepID=A0A160VSL9_9EURY|nr:signal peptidase I [Thermococcus chitonophagus]ASJ17456.1 S26 family signal peptidase [Thermococcus chitonophagus]CUX78103.1 Signal peptidase I [Thermococcus chitonophagus]
MEGAVKEVISTALIILVALGLYSGLRLVLHTNMPLVVVVSGSMEPVFYRGDVVVLEGVKPEDVKIGDVVVYKSPLAKYPIIHRVREIKEIVVNGREELCFVTWGDNNPIPDLYPTPAGVLDCVPQQAIEAKALLVIPKIGWISIKLREIFGLGG